jgi:hypothetical protein
LTYKQSIQAIDIEIEIINSIPSSILTAKIDDKSKFKSENGKILQNSEANIDFAGYSKIAEGLSGSIDALNSISGAAGATVVAGGVGALTLSSLLGNSLGFLTKMIQIIEFTALMELFNVEYDRTLASLLSAIAKLTNI